MAINKTISQIRGQDVAYWRVYRWTPEVDTNTTTVTLYGYETREQRDAYAGEPLDTRAVKMTGIFETRASVYEELQTAASLNQNNEVVGKYEFYQAEEI